MDWNSGFAKAARWCALVAILVAQLFLTAGLLFESARAQESQPKKLVEKPKPEKEEKREEQGKEPHGKADQKANQDQKPAQPKADQEGDAVDGIVRGVMQLLPAIRIAPAARLAPAAKAAERKVEEKKAVAAADAPAEAVAAEGAIAVQVLAAPAMAAAGGDPANEDDQLMAIGQQYAPQVQLVVKSEIAFIRSICQPNEEQVKKLREVGESSRKDLLRQIGKTQKQMMQGFRGAPPRFPNPQRVITDELGKAVDKFLSTEQATQYKAELAQRESCSRRASVVNLVAIMDEMLSLTTDQRTALESALIENWQPGWDDSLERFMYVQNYVPTLPDKVLQPILNNVQQKIWREVPKQDTVFFGVMMGFIPDFQDEGEAAPVPAPPVPAPDP